MTFATALLVGLLTCKPGVAPLFALPPPAVTTGTLRAASVPGAVPEAQSVARLDGHAMTALFATSEALLERAIFPQMTNHGAGRDVLTPSALASADFGHFTRTNYTDDMVRPSPWMGPNIWNVCNYVPCDLGLAADRDYSATGARLGKVYDLFKTVMGIPDSGSTSAIVLDYGERSWLDPEIALMGEAPTGEWVLDDETQTANWQKYLMMLKERRHDDITSYGKCPLGDYYGIGITGSPEYSWADYMDAGEFPTIGDLTDLDSFDLDGKCISGSVRGNKQPPLSDLLKKVAHVSSVSNLWAQDLRRVRRDQFALANAIAGSCHVLLDDCDPVAYYYNTNHWAANYTLSGYRGPLYRFLQERVTGTVQATMVLKGEGQGVGFGDIDEMPSRYGFGAVLDADKLETVSFSNSVSAAYSTQTVNAVTAAWRDESGVFGIGLKATAPMTADGIHFESSDFANADMPSGDYPLYWVREITPGAVSHSLYVRVDRGNGVVDSVNVGYMGWPGESSWTSSVTIVYSASYRGAETVETKTPFYGPTFMDKKVPKGVDDRECSIMGYLYHPMLYASGILRSADMHAFACCGIATNAETIVTAANGNGFAWGEPVTKGDAVKDTWAYFKGSVLFRNLADQNAMRSAFERAYDNTMKDAVSTCADKAPGDFDPPGNINATSISAGTLKKMLDRLEPIMGLDWYPSDGVPERNETGVFARWNREDETVQLVRGDGTAVSGSDFAFTLTVSAWDKKAGDGMRGSAAAYYHIHPYLITYWNFPLMGVYGGAGL